MDLTNLNRDRKKDGRKNPIDVSTMIYGKVPPQARDLEEAVLGALMLESDAFGQVSDILKPECFYVDANKKIYKAIQILAYKLHSVDMLTVVEQLRTTEELDLVGGPYYVTKLTNAVTSSAHIEAHSRIIFQKFVQRELIRIGGEMVSDSYEDSTDVFDLLDESTGKLHAINNEIQEQRTVHVADVSIDVIMDLSTRVHNAKEGIENPNEIYTGFDGWDGINGRLFPGMYVVAGRPGMGKGILLTELIVRMGKYFPVGVINGEMTSQQLIIRVGCNLKNIDNQLWKKDLLEVTEEELQEVYEAMQEVQTLQLHIEPNKFIHKIAAKIRKWVKKDGVKVILADFLTLFKVSEEMERYMTETQKLNYIMGVFTDLCRELNVPIILFSQLNRELYKRGGNKEPNMADLKGSGNIEEFAFQISFLHRPEYYDIKEDEFGESTKDLLYHIVVKHRDGKLGRLKHKFIPQCSQLGRWESQLVQGWNASEPNPF